MSDFGATVPHAEMTIRYLLKAHPLVWTADHSMLGQRDPNYGVYGRPRVIEFLMIVYGNAYKWRNGLLVTDDVRDIYKPGHKLSDPEKHVLDNLEHYATVAMHMPMVYPGHNEYSALFTIPDDVTGGWLEVAEEAAHMVLAAECTQYIFDPTAAKLDAEHLEKMKDWAREALQKINHIGIKSMR